jgi:hypothetical protein
VSKRVKYLYAAVTLVLVVWSFARPSLLPLLLLVGLALTVGLHALAAMDARRDPLGRGGPTDHDISEVRSRYPGGV